MSATGVQQQKDVNEKQRSSGKHDSVLSTHGITGWVNGLFLREGIKT
jgi:hypothetical protein